MLVLFPFLSLYQRLAHQLRTCQLLCHTWKYHLSSSRLPLLASLSSPPVSLPRINASTNFPIVDLTRSSSPSAGSLRTYTGSVFDSGRQPRSSLGLCSNLPLIRITHYFLFSLLVVLWIDYSQSLPSSRACSFLSV
jgi:hypothetical protein